MRSVSTALRRHVSIHVPLAEHDGCLQDVLKIGFAVSIHVPLAEHDEGIYRNIADHLSFNSHAPRGARLTAR